MEGISNTTTVDEKTMKIWNEFYFKHVTFKTRHKSLWASILVGILGGVLIGRVNLVMDIIGVIFICLAIYLVMIIEVIPLIRMHKSVMNHMSFEIPYIFYENYFRYTSKGLECQAEYKDVSYIYETMDYIYFYFANNRRVFIVDKHQWDQETQEKVSHIFMKYDHYKKY